MAFDLETVLTILLFVNEVHSTPLDLKKQNDKFSREEYAAPACIYKIVGSQGSIYRDGILPSQENITCEWTIDAMKGLAIVLEFEHFKLPATEESPCEFYVEISYETQHNSFKRKFCPADKVGKLHTDSQQVVVNFKSGRYLKEYDNSHFGFKINYTAVATIKPQIGPNSAVLIILLLSMATTVTIALCLYCSRCRLYGRNSGDAPSQARVSQEPNAPTQQQLDDAFITQRNALLGLQTERKKMSFSIFQSQGSSYSTRLNRWSSNSHLPTAKDLEEPKSEENIASIMTTPRSVFPELRRKWSENSVKRIDHLRTKLVARFSSASSGHSSSDISVFFPASERRTYSQLSCDEDTKVSKPEDSTTEDEERGECEIRRIGTGADSVPSIVIEFVK